MAWLQRAPSWFSLYVCSISKAWSKTSVKFAIFSVIKFVISPFSSRMFARFAWTRVLLKHFTTWNCKVFNVIKTFPNDIKIEINFNENTCLFCFVRKSDDIDVIIVPQGIQDIINHMPSNFFSHPRHTSRGVYKDKHVLRTGSSFDVPAPRSAVEQVDVFGVPGNRRVLSHEPRRTAEVLPGQRGVDLVVVDERLVQHLGPLYCFFHMLRAIVDIRWHVHRWHARVDPTAEMCVVRQFYWIVFCVHVLKIFYFLFFGFWRWLLSNVHYPLQSNFPMKKKKKNCNLRVVSKLFPCHWITVLSICTGAMSKFKRVEDFIMSNRLKIECLSGIKMDYQFFYNWSFHIKSMTSSFHNNKFLF